MRRLLNCIMIIEDCDADSYLHRKVIEDVGAAKDLLIMRYGDDALRRISSNSRSGAAQPELIFLDINTPGMDGWDFVEEFEKLDAKTREGSVIVMLSGSLNPDDRRRAESLALIKEYRAKPLSREAMREILERHFPPPPDSL